MTGSVRHLRPQHQSFLLEVVAREDRIDRVEHVLGGDVGEKTESAAIDPEQRHAALRDVPRRVQQGAVAADRDDEVDVLSELRLRDGRETVRQLVIVRIGRGKHADAVLAKMREHLLGGLGYARLAQTPPQADRWELLRHPRFLDSGRKRLLAWPADCALNYHSLAYGE